MQKQTITIKTFFGEKTVNIDEFEKRWVDTINPLYGLTNSREDIDKCKQMKKWVCIPHRVKKHPFSRIGIGSGNGRIKL